MEKTWLALRPINLGEMSEVPIQREEQEKNQPARLVPDEAFKDVIEWTAPSVGDSYAGFALEVGEGNYDEWKRAVKAKGALDVARLKDGVAQLTGSDGRTLRLTHNQTNNLPLVECDGSPRQWDKANAVYQAWDAANKPSAAPVAQTWGGGELRVEAGGYRFTSGFNAAGKVVWSEQAAR